MAATELVFDKTTMGTLRVRYEKVRSINAETVVETRARALIFELRLEAVRRQFANGGDELSDIQYHVGRL
jgi:AraC-like DNA-binding protein